MTPKLSVDEATAFVHEKRDGLGDIFGGPKSTRGDSSDNFLRTWHINGISMGKHVCGYGAGCDSINGDPILS